MKKFIIKIEKEGFESLNFEGVECYALLSTLGDDFVKDFKKKAKDSIVLMFGEESAEKCKKLDLDGVIVDLSKSEKISAEVKDIRAKIGDKILGIVARGRRHEAMVVSENEPDFILFKGWKDSDDRLKDLLLWYSDLFLIQSALLLEEEGVDFDHFAVDIVVMEEGSYKNLVAKKD